MSWLVVGLGNPGEQYARTRHNLGAMVVESLASQNGSRFKKVRFLPLEVADTSVGRESLYLARSLRFMNESGPSYASFAKKRGIDAGNVLAVHDELDLPFGALRVKFGGSSAGHNGLKSLQSALGSPDFYRVRLGVGRPQGRQEPADYVLKAFGKAERDDVEVLVADGADAVLSLVRDGLEQTQDRFNRSGA
jgi:PTH1 family peptidyl-tRNA hydrolase